MRLQFRVDLLALGNPAQHRLFRSQILAGQLHTFSTEPGKDAAVLAIRIPPSYVTEW